jgi:hypothetical protein
MLRRRAAFGVDDHICGRERRLGVPDARHLLVTIGNLGRILLF